MIQKHSVVRELIDHEWLHLIQIDSETGRMARRLASGHYEILGHQLH